MLQYDHTPILRACCALTLSQILMAEGETVSSFAGTKSLDGLKTGSRNGFYLFPD